MTRPLELTRSEAEGLVDLIEEHGGVMLQDIAVGLREQWGMVTREAEEAFNADRLRDEAQKLASANK